MKKIIRFKENQYVVVESESVTQGVPYADYFTVMTRFCISRVNASTSHLLVKTFINFKRQPNYISKSKRSTCFI